VPPDDNYVLNLLCDSGLVTQSQIEQTKARVTGTLSPLEALVQEGVISPTDISRSLACQAQMDWIDLSTVLIPPEVIQQIRPEDARRLKAIPIRFGSAGLVVAVGDPFDINTIEGLRFLLQREIELVCTSPAKISEALIKYYGTADEASDILLQQIGEEADVVLEATENASVTLDDDAPIIRLISMLLTEACRRGASDIHFEPLDRKFRVRFRIDGVLEEVQGAPKRLQSSIISRLKLMTGSMSIAERRLPQDGRIRVKIDQKPIDLRVSTIPTNHGESIVMRVLDKSSLLLGLPELGLRNDDREKFEQILRLPDGLVLVTGPTGAGKTSTLYACLQHINKAERKIITVEEPVEYQINGINQVQVNPSIGLTFPVVLRSILRQAPNVVMVGEIRDLETASIAISASLTGHLVFSTLHTNDASSAIVRLFDIGIPPFLVASSIRTIVAQRLVRKLCSNCRHPTELGQTDFRALGFKVLPPEKGLMFQSMGCDQCRGTGYRGRVAVFEILLVNDEVRKIINDRGSVLAIRRRARELGTCSLREDARRKLLAGLTSAQEVVSATLEDIN